uniref:Uncharacterized protein n=1 Tax=Rhizophora mucronata TaxID=61149 RepID=A0A2P2KEY4_RHIMU
MEQRNYLQVFI